MSRIAAYFGEACRFCLRTGTMVHRFSAKAFDRVKNYPDKLEWVMDRLWPIATFEPAKADEAPAESVDATSETGKQEEGADSSNMRHIGAFDALNLLFAEEQRRRQGVEGRLAGLGSLAAVVSTLSIGVAANQNLTILSRVLYSYLLIQLVRVGLASIAGLGRANYNRLLDSDFIAAKCDELARSRLVSQVAENLEIARINNNEKVTQLAIAHTAARNFFGGLLTIVPFLVFGIATHPVRDAAQGTKTPIFCFASALPGPAGPAEAHEAPDEPASTPDEPASTPDEPASTPDEPASTPDEPAATPDEPAAKPGEPAAKPGEPAAMPVEPAAMPVEPAGTPGGPAPTPVEPAATTRSG